MLAIRNRPPAGTGRRVRTSRIPEVPLQAPAGPLTSTMAPVTAGSGRPGMAVAMVPGSRGGNASGEDAAAGTAGAVRGGGAIAGRAGPGLPVDPPPAGR